MIALLLYINDKISTNKNIVCPYLQPITFNQVKELVDNKESFILYVGAKDCSHCKVFEPRIKIVLNEYKINVKYLDFSTLSTDEKNEFNAIANIEGTPTVIFINNGIEEYTKNRISGAVYKDAIIKKLKDNGYIKIAE
jgi:predicted bacteriocin transport accessory protein